MCLIGAIGCGVLAILRAYRHYGLLLENDVVLVPALHLVTILLSAVAIHRFRKQRGRTASEVLLLVTALLIVLGLASISIKLYVEAPR